MALTVPTAWKISIAVSVAMMFCLIWLWRNADCCPPEYSSPLETKADVEKATKDIKYDLLLPTGLYIQSLVFESANDVRITGRLWQRLRADQKMPEGTELGVLFPDAISPHKDNLTPVYEEFPIKDASGEAHRLTIWNFQAILREQFDYRRYPLDGKAVWVRMWTKDPEAKIQLVPDLGAYLPEQVRTSHLGIAKGLVQGEWEVRDTHFGYCRMWYETDFGRMTGIDQKEAATASRPELRFFIVLQRNFVDAFLVNLVPLFVTFGLLFGLLMTVSHRKEIAERFGFNTLAVYGACSGLFFITLLGHIQIRREFAGSQIVYIEYFYMMAYVLLLAVSIVTFFVTRPETASSSWFLRRGAINVKLWYWPSILLFSLLMSAWVLPIGSGAEIHRGGEGQERLLACKNSIHLEHDKVIEAG